MFEYQKYNRYFAKVTGKMEHLCAQELLALGAESVHVGYRGVSFTAKKDILYSINYQSRLATRILAPLLTFSCHSTKYLKKTAEKIPWDTFLTLDTKFAITATVTQSAIRHSKYAALCLKDSIVDYFWKKYDKRPDIDVKHPDILFNLHIDRNKAVISLDTSGDSLHKRGYRSTTGVAPLQETLAAALINLSNWNVSQPLWDCMCGSGTILCEALMKYCNIPAQYLRKKFGFYFLPDFDHDIWHQVRDTCIRRIKPLTRGIIEGSDISSRAISMAQENLSKLPYNENVILSSSDFQKRSEYPRGIIICNPPYGIRLGDKKKVQELYTKLGNFLKKKCCGTSAYIYLGDPSMKKFLKLKPSKSIPLVNGALNGTLLKIDSYRIKFR